MSASKKPKKGQRTARLILPSGYPFAQLYSDQYCLLQVVNSQNGFCKKQKFEKSQYQKDQGKVNSSNDFITYDHHITTTKCSNSNSILNENSLSTKNNDFIEIKGKGMLPTISFVKGKVILS